MASTTVETQVVIPDHVLLQMRDLYDRGLYVQSYNLGAAYGPIRKWAGLPARILAVRLAGNLEADRLRNALATVAWKENPDSLEAAFYYSGVVRRRRGLLAQWEFVRNHGKLEAASPEIWAAWLTEHATVSMLLRDFDRAETLLKEAFATQSEHPWIYVVQAMLYELLDRFDEALVSGRKALEIKPWYRPAVQSCGHTLMMLGKDDEAVELLSKGMQRLESPAVGVTLGSLLMELGRFDEARNAFIRSASLSPIMEKSFSQWIQVRLVDAAYYMGDFDAACDAARQSESEFHTELAQRLADKSTVRKRVLLPVKFIRQHHLTCAPATMAAIFQYWEDQSAAGNGDHDATPVDQFAIADEICYDGTPTHLQRDWAEKNNWIVREFTMTDESARALIDRGVPFTVSTVSVTNAHMQAVVGYDEYRQTFLIRDPSLRMISEFRTPQFMKFYESTGPEAMVLVPQDRAELLEGLELPDSELYDLEHQQLIALDRHDRETAGVAVDKLRAISPEHRITLNAVACLASYDGDLKAQETVASQLQQKYPECEIMKMRTLRSLDVPEKRKERLALLQDICRNSRCHPAFQRQLAMELSYDARTHEEATRLVNQAIRRLPDLAVAYHTLACILWDQRQFDKAFELYRIAHCLDDKNERLAHSYFTASRWVKRTEEALEFLQGRWTRFASKSSLPARTLYQAYSQLALTSEALEILEATVMLRPDDTSFHLFVAAEYASYGNFDSATELHAKVKDRGHRAEWLQTAALIAESRQDFEFALSYWQQYLAVEPLAIGAHTTVAQILRRIRGREEAVDYLKRIAGSNPHNWSIKWALLESLDSFPEREALLSDLIAMNPSDTAARRSLALDLGRQSRFSEAFAQIEEAQNVESHSAENFQVLGTLCKFAGDLQRARSAFRSAIEIDVDCNIAIRGLLDSCSTAEDRRAAIHFVAREMKRQVMFGRGLLVWQSEAASVLKPEEVLATLKEVVAERPDLWHAWVAISEFLADSGRLDEALGYGREAATRFPLLRSVWLCLARIYSLQNRIDEQIKALTTLLTILPHDPLPTRELALAYQRKGDNETAASLLEELLARNAEDAFAMGCLADLAWKKGETAAAIDLLQKAVLLEPDYLWGWQTLSAWGEELGRPELPREPARELTRQHPEEARSWVMFASIMNEPEELSIRLEALERAAELDPHDLDTHDQRARYLALDGRFEEALAACDPPAWEGRPPQLLRARKAWITGLRGDRELAVRLVEEIIEEDPLYYFGWSLLAEWYELMRDWKKFEKAAATMVELAPSNPVAHCVLGMAKQSIGDREAAKRSFEKSFALAPDASNAGRFLFEVQREEGDFDGAVSTLKALELHWGGPLVSQYWVEMFVDQRDFDSAFQTFRELCLTHNGTDAGPIHAAYLKLASVHIGLARKALKILDDCMLSENPPAALVVLWVTVSASRKRRLEIWKTLRRLRKYPDLERLALVTFLDEGAEKSIYFTRWITFLYYRRIKQDMRLCAAAGRVYLMAGYYSGTIKLMKNYRSRTGVQTWMLFNYALALRFKGKWKAAEEVALHAITFPPDHATPQHYSVIALERALRGEIEGAEEALRLSGMDCQENRFRRQLTEAILNAVNGTAGTLASKADKITVARTATAQLKAARDLTSANMDRIDTQLYWKTVRFIARRIGGINGFLWWTRRHLAELKPRM